MVCPGRLRSMYKNKSQWSLHSAFPVSVYTLFLRTSEFRLRLLISILIFPGSYPTAISNICFNCLSWSKHHETEKNVHLLKIRENTWEYVSFDPRFIMLIFWPKKSLFPMYRVTKINIMWAAARILSNIVGNSKFIFLDQTFSHGWRARNNIFGPTSAR